eukprot:12904132-Alexandrium_andersonii.AAC.1
MAAALRAWHVAPQGGPRYRGPRERGGPIGMAASTAAPHTLEVEAPRSNCVEGLRIEDAAPPPVTPSTASYTSSMASMPLCTPLSLIHI